MNYYLANIAGLTTLNSKRLVYTSKKDHLLAQRQLRMFIRGE